MSAWSGAGRGVYLTHFGNRILVTFGGEVIDIGSGDSAGGIIVDAANNNWTFLTDVTPLYARHVPPNFMARRHDEIAFSHALDNQWWILADENSTERAAWKWRSKEFLLPSPTNFGAMQLFGSGSVTLTVFTDGAARYTTTVTATKQGAIIRLPAGFLIENWSFQFEGTSGELVKCHIATTIGELKGA